LLLETGESTVAAVVEKVEVGKGIETDPVEEEVVVLVLTGRQVEAEEIEEDLRVLEEEEEGSVGDRSGFVEVKEERIEGDCGRDEG